MHASPSDAEPVADTGEPGGRLVVVATPIGNLGDLSPRAAAALREATLVAAEDTRRTRKLLDHIGASPPMVSYHDHNERDRSGELLDRVAAGDTVVLVSDAGTPGLADPGYIVVREAIARGLAVEAVPGPNAVMQALVLSGLPMDRFTFEGFLPRKAGARDARLRDLVDELRTMVFYVTPHRVVEELEAIAELLGDRPAALSRELTKLHEETLRGTVRSLAALAGERRGEMTLVVAGRPGDGPAPEGATLADRVRELMATGLSRKDATAKVAKVTGVPRRDVYQAVLDAGGAVERD